MFQDLQKQEAGLKTSTWIQMGTNRKSPSKTHFKQIKAIQHLPQMAPER